MPALDDVEVRHDLDAADHGGGDRRVDEQDVLKLAVDPVSDADAAVERIEMDVGRAAIDGAFENLAEQLRHRDGLARLLQLLADVALNLIAVGRDRDDRGGLLGGRRLGRLSGVVSDES